MSIKMEDRPTCSCGVKMKLVRHEGYYDKFNMWVCNNCSLDEKIQDEEPDKVEKGGYVR